MRRRGGRGAGSPSPQRAPPDPAADPPASSFVLLYAVALLDMAASSLTFALTPGRIIELGGDAKTVGLLSGFAGALQLVGAPLVGRYSDRFAADRRWVLVVGLLAAALSAAVAAAAQEPTLFLLSRVPSGLFTHTLNNLRAASADLAERTGAGAPGRARPAAAHFAHLNSAVGVGLALGSFIGGQLSYRTAALMASGGYVGGAALVGLGCPPLLPAARAKGAGSSEGAKPSLKDRLRKAGQRGADPSDDTAAEGPPGAAWLLGALVCMRLLFSSAATAQRETFALSVKSRMGLSEGWIGAFLSYKGLVAMVTNSAGLAPLLSSGRWASHVLLLAAAWGLTGAYLLSAVALHSGSSALLAFNQVPLTVSTNVCRTLLQAIPIAAVPAQQRAEMLGWFGAVDAAAKILAPVGAGWVLHMAGATTTLLACALCAAIMAVGAGIAGNRLATSAAAKHKAA